MSADSHKSSNEMPLQIRVYSSGKSENRIGQTIATLVKEFPAAHSLGFRFAERNIRTKYRQSILGIFWAFLPPLATAAIWIILYKSGTVKFGDVGAPYPLFVITGMMLWSVFSSSLLMPMNTTQSSRSILVKINFPKESLIINSFYEIVFNAIISLIIIVVCMAIYKVHITFHVLLFFPVILIMIILGMALGLLLLPFSLLYKDIQFVLPSILQFAMYLTPVVYAQPIYKGAGRLLAFNPISPLLISARNWLLGINNSIPHSHIFIVAIISVFLLIIGIFLQRKTMQILIERMGS